MVRQPAVASAVRDYAAAGARIGCSRPSEPSSCTARRVACAASASAASAGGDETVSAGPLRALARRWSWHRVTAVSELMLWSVDMQKVPGHTQ